MATFDLPEMPKTRLSPQLFMGAASPLWAYFGAAAAGGVAYWWMTRWTQPVNLEALFGAVSRAATPPAPVLEAVEATVETVEEVVEAAAETVAEALPELPVGGEAAPISPLVEALAAPEPDPTPEPEAIVEAAPEPVVETPPEPMMEATADPIPEPVAKPRVRKSPPANGLEA